MDLAIYPPPCPPNKGGLNESWAWDSLLKKHDNPGGNC